MGGFFIPLRLSFWNVITEHGDKSFLRFLWWVREWSSHFEGLQQGPRGGGGGGSIMALHGNLFDLKLIILGGGVESMHDKNKILNSTEAKVELNLSQV